MRPLIPRDTADLPVAPPGVTPNYIDPPNNGHTPITVCLFTLVLAAIAVAVRVFTKITIVRKTGLDDCKSEMLKPTVNTDLATIDCAVLALVRWLSNQCTWHASHLRLARSRLLLPLVFPVTS